ncbi:hypothetical protein [Endozoicomonas sp. GU-1]|uniref:hypothetical protein n=1 Tax=Endozoicomonas sp. GU-1 TaxID=3009078 RepID=UPI0022B53241|nr:hypothetical protein [Endozoicomonas sp. GU-1]WBA79913.1 hypothetical protein O2T12_16280 [Endozoicomonas sp. GU-1]WBA87490.1 hypothetical protein O3276_05525 [Endozoicomonas sp. GU-1]
MDNSAQTKLLKEQLTDTSAGRSATISEQIVELATASCELFTDLDGKPFASFHGNSGEQQTYAIYSKTFKLTLGFWYYQATKKTAKQEHLKDALEALASTARYAGTTQPVYTRVAHHEGAIYVDLSNDQWQVIKVDATGWIVLDISPVKFIRTDAMRSLPVPTTGGDINNLWSFVNVPEKDRLLVLAWMVEALRPETQKPILEILGSHGTGKSHTSSIIRSLIDPNKALLRALPKSIDDLYVTAAANWVLTSENVSHLPERYQDAMCQISTGTGYAKRELYSDGNEVTFEVKRPQIVNGITPLATRQDMADRTVSITLPLIPRDQRQNDKGIKADFKKAYPELFGALLEILAKSLDILSEIQLEQLPRLADFGILGEAVGRVMGTPGVFNDLFFENQKELALNALDSCPAAMALIALCNQSTNTIVFTGTVGQLFNTVESYKGNDFEGWPKSPKGFSNAIKRQSAALAMIGISFTFHKRGNSGIPVTVTKQITQPDSLSTHHTQQISTDSEHSEPRELESTAVSDNDDLTEMVI